MSDSLPPAPPPGLDWLAAREAAPSRPEPPPRPLGVEVTPILLAWLDEVGAPPEVAALVRARDAFGRAKYGQGLRAGDGRDDLTDLEQELGDALQYASKARINHVPLGRVLPLLRALVRLIEEAEGGGCSTR